MKLQIALVDPNTLEVISMKLLLKQVMPIAEIVAFASFEELAEEGSGQFFHYFVTTNILLAHRNFFLNNRNKTIVLTALNDPSTQLAGFRSLCITQPEDTLVKSLLRLQQIGHSHGRNLPPVALPPTPKILTLREIEVLSLIVQGYINKEIGDKLNIGTTTVITHRKNIMKKLGAKSVSSLTIYAVINGYVDINSV